MKPLRLFWSIAIAVVVVLCFAPVAQAFCGFYVAKADTSLYNQASQVVIARDGDRTVLTMANDFQGEVADFAMVVPVPVLIQEDQVNVGNPQILERLDSFSAPRLVEYFDPDPCEPQMLYDRTASGANQLAMEAAPAAPASSAALGVTVEAQFTVGEYEIVILSAEESDGLETWLQQNDYQIPAGASELLRPYIRQNMKFFVAKVNLEEFDRAGYQKLRPLQIAYESPRFMLPIRLGMMNAQGEQDLVAYLLSPRGQVELTNYRTVNVPSNVDIPVFVKDEFNDFYTSMFTNAYDREGQNVAFLEYAWNMAWCDPCSADPLTPEELRQAGVFWLDEASRPQPMPRGGMVMPPPLPTNSVFITRLHVRYTRNKFPADLIFQETSNEQAFQGRYVLRHPYLEEASCEAGREYRRSLPTRFEQEAQTLAQLTGWDIQDIRRKQPEVEVRPRRSWWRRLWD